MSSTNKTTNYELSQFIGSDKPAWLTDYNSDMGKIDAGVYTAQTTATGADGKATANATAIGDLTTLTTTAKTNLVAAVNEVNTSASTAYNAATSAASTATQAKNEITNFETKFNLANVTSINAIGGYSSMVQSCNLKVAQNSDGSIFKLYGSILLRNGSTTTVALTPVAGLNGYYGMKTTLKLASAPASAYLVSPCGIKQQYLAGQPVAAITYPNMAVDNEGYIYVEVIAASTATYTGNNAYSTCFLPCIYFNGTFGDTPVES